MPIELTKERRPSVASKQIDAPGTAEQVSAEAPEVAPTGAPRRLSIEGFIFCVFWLDAALLFAAGIIAYQTATVWSPDYAVQNIVFSGSITAWVMAILVFARCYRFNLLRSPLRHFMKLFMPFAGAFLSGLLIYLALLEPAFFNQGWLLKYFLVATGFLAIGRTFALYGLVFGARRGWLFRRVAILGATSQGEKLMRHLAQDHLRINRIVGVFDERAAKAKRTALDVQVAGSTQELLDQARRGLIDDVIIALPWSAEDRLKEIISQLRILAVGVQLGADLAAFQFPGKMSTDVMSGLPMISLSNNPLSGWRRIAKALEDRIIGAFLVVLFSPIMLVVAIAIKLESPGPIFFRQTRIGFNNRPFEVLKFRSMTHQPAGQDGVTVQATKDDQRITRVGRIIRRSSLDELPQLFNVLSGSMSLVGPRPHAVDHNREYGAQINGYFERHRLKPGMTGLAQVNGLRGETDTLEKMEYRVRYDLYYIENWSLFMDLEVLALTAFIGFMGRNAY